MRKRKHIIFGFVVNKLGFLKRIPLLAWVFDAFLRVELQLFHPHILIAIDEIEETLEKWPGISIQQHKYGGVQFNYLGTELGHIHSNGLADILLNQKLKEQLILDGKAQEHHIYKKAGWISFYINKPEDKKNVIALFKAACQLRQTRKNTVR